MGVVVRGGARRRPRASRRDGRHRRSCPAGAAARRSSTGPTRDGRDVDVFFYAVDRAGAPVPPGVAMLRYGVEGQAVRWSPAHGFALAPPTPVPAVRFDAVRNWAFVARAALGRGRRGRVDLHPARPRRDPSCARPPRRARIPRSWRAPRTSSTNRRTPSRTTITCTCGSTAILAIARSAAPIADPCVGGRRGWKYMAAPFGRPDERDVRTDARARRCRARGRAPLIVGAALGVVRWSWTPSLTGARAGRRRGGVRAGLVGARGRPRAAGARRRRRRRGSPRRASRRASRA